MEKVTITQEQATAIEKLKGLYAVDILVETFLRDGYIYNYPQFDEMSKREFIKSLYVGYEVEQPKFKAGEWVVKKNQREVIGKLYMNEVDCFDVDRAEKTGLSFISSEWERATAEEIEAEQKRQFWMKLGREVGEFHDDDQIITVWDSIARVNTSRKDSGSAKELYKANQLKGFYPVESFVKFPK